ncbi:MAG: HPr family phosphocarrier protein [Proteobacteria bacterium]|nr:HPr family phosphocarrier protein [Pseudomonadota bacterium]MCK4868524.1 HPr family phosphocarrier protein [Alphaproteobacteria bacterium]
MTALVAREVTIVNRRGLHARAAARFVKLAGDFDAEILVSKDGAEVSGLSIMGLMMLAAAPGTQIELCATGNQAMEAVDAIAALVAAGFDED